MANFDEESIEYLFSIYNAPSSDTEMKNSISNSVPCFDKESLAYMSDITKRGNPSVQRSTNQVVYPKQLSMKQFLQTDEEDFGNTPSIDDLLRLPECPENGGTTMDEVLDKMDIEIAKRRKKHEEEMATVGTEIASEKKRQKERKERMKQNAVLRDRLESEISKSDVKRMFQENLPYLRDIESGSGNSSRHEAFHKSSRTRHALKYAMISHPFTDEQLEWTLEEISKVWMRDKKEQMENNEYVWKVILAECFIKFYMDHFVLDKDEAEQRIRETPLREADNSSEDESCSDASTEMR